MMPSLQTQYNERFTRTYPHHRFRPVKSKTYTSASALISRKHEHLHDKRRALQARLAETKLDMVLVTTLTLPQWDTRLVH